MKTILRSVIDFGDNRISREALDLNWRRLADSTFDWPVPEEGRIAAYIREFYNLNLEVPSRATIRDHFTQENDSEATMRLDDLATAEVYAHAQFKNLLNEQVKKQREAAFRAALERAKEIAGRGVTVQEGREKKTLQGVDEAYAYIAEVASELTTTTGGKIRGDLRDDPPDAWVKYQDAERNRGKAFGALTGINEIDKVCHGCKRGELWVHAAFTGELKTTFALNVAYNLVTRYRVNVLYVSMEMPYDQLMLNIYTMHSSNGRWRGRAALDYRKVRDGELNPEEKAFYEEVLNDFEKNPEYCRFKVWAPDKDISINDIRVEGERLHKEMDVGFIVVDHGGLVESAKKHKDYTIELNAVLRDAKKALALRFNGREGVPVFLLFQLNRQGKDEADKNDGRYKIKALSYANEAERSADYITTTYLNDQHRENGTTIFCNLKNRDNPLFAPFQASVDFNSRRILSLDPTTSTVAGMRVDSSDGHEELLRDLNLNV